MSSFEREKDNVLRQMGWFKPTGAILAGGAITSTFTNQPVADFDLYFKSKESFVATVRNAYEDGLFGISNSGRAITFSDNGTILQFMHFGFFASAHAIFNFTCCMAALDMDSKQFEFCPTFLSDTSKRDLVFNHRTAYPLASAMRVLKYREKGYTIRKSELLKIMTACAMRGVTGWDDLAEQIGGRYGAAAKLGSGEEFSLDSVISAVDAMKDTTLASTPRDADAALEEFFGAGSVVDQPPRRSH